MKNLLVTVSGGRSSARMARHIIYISSLSVGGSVLRMILRSLAIGTITPKYLTNMLSKAEFNKNISLYLEAHRFCCKNGYRVSAEAIGYRIPFVRIVVSEPGREEIKGTKTYTQEEAQLKIYEICLHIYQKMTNLHAQNNKTK